MNGIDLNVLFVTCGAVLEPLTLKQEVVGSLYHFLQLLLQIL